MVDKFYEIESIKSTSLYGAPRKAFNNIVRALNFDVFLPKNVFNREEWSNFLFFPSDYIFSEEFVNLIGDLLRIESAHVCCLLNLSETNSFEFEKIAAIFLDDTTSHQIFDAKLRGNGPQDGWLYRVDRYACASDVGKWCVYCDKENDIAVFASRNDSEGREYQLFFEKLGARPITNLVTETNPYPFPFNQLTPDWSLALVENYSIAVSAGRVV